jgi:hypothetical protein
VPVPFIGPEAMEQRHSGSNRRWLGGASRHNSFGFDSAPQGRGNDGAELGEGVDVSGRRSGGRRHVAREALGQWMESVVVAA